MRSHAALSNSRPPRTDCSDSMECGGTRRESSCGSAGVFMARIIPAGDRCLEEADKKKAGKTRLFVASNAVLLLGLFADHGNRDVDDNVGMQRYRNRVLAGHLQRALRH